MEPQSTMKSRPEMKIQIPTFFGRSRADSTGSKTGALGGLFERNEIETCNDMEDGSLSGFDQSIQQSRIETPSPMDGIAFFSFRSRESSFNRSESPRPSSIDFARPVSSRAFNKFSAFLADAVSSVSTPRQFGRTSSFDISQQAGPPKKLKKSPNDITEIPETPSKEDTLHEIRSSGYYSRLNNDFTIVDVIGTGSFGTVYRAQGIIDGVLYAVKKSRRRPHNQSERATMMHEVQALASLSAYEEPEKTSSIVRYYSAWMEDEYLCIQMELCESCACDIADFNNECAYTLLRDIFHALDVLHSNEFVHLDVKPANILVKRQRFKLGDFGLALHTVDGKFQGNVEEGDSRYMARELLNWGPIPDLTKCDIFSLGITVFELYTGVNVEPNGSNWHMMRSGEYLFPPNTPDELMSILNELMAPEAVNRPSAKACLQTYDALKSPLELELQKQTLRMQSLEERLNEMSVAEASIR